MYVDQEAEKEEVRAEDERMHVDALVSRPFADCTSDLIVLQAVLVPPLESVLDHLRSLIASCFNWYVKSHLIPNAICYLCMVSM